MTPPAVVLELESSPVNVLRSSSWIGVLSSGGMFRNGVESELRLVTFSIRDVSFPDVSPTKEGHQFV
jgi:hypothetical protein